MTTHHLNEHAILDTLRAVVDPELCCNIVDLGLVYAVAIAGSKVTVTMTLTTPGCPLQESIAEGVRNALISLDEVEEVEVNLVFDPPWTPARILHTTH
jgi:metal-sulfur cluster biosynthetic enzyme